MGPCPIPAFEMSWRKCGRSSRAPAGTRRSLEELVRDLETLAGPAGADAEFSASLRERATDALRRLEASHPVLSSTLGNVVDTLAFFGL